MSSEIEIILNLRIEEGKLVIASVDLGYDQIPWMAEVACEGGFMTVVDKLDGPDDRVWKLRAGDGRQITLRNDPWITEFVSESLNDKDLILKLIDRVEFAIRDRLGLEKVDTTWSK